MKYATANLAVLHGAPVTVNNHVGIAVKQRPAAAGAASGTPQKQIAISEQFAIITKGIVEVLTVGSPVKGDTVWINVTNNVLTLTDPGGGNGRKFGRVAELPGERGGRTTHMRVDLDAKDSF